MREDKFNEAGVAYRAGDFKSEFQPLIDDLYRQEVVDARKMPLEEKLLLGERLFRWACEATLSGIRNENPRASEQECQRILSERIELGKRIGTL